MVGETDITEEDNRARVCALFDEFATNHNSKYLIVLNFDTLLVEGHLSKAVTHALQSKKMRDKILDNHVDYSFEALAKLNTGTLQGIEYDKALETKKKVVEEMHWKKYATDMLGILSQEENHSVLVYSCGRYTPQRMKLDSAGLGHVPLIATEASIEDGIVRNKHVITDRLKGEMIARLREREVFEKIFAIGNACGDKYMQKEADYGLAVKTGPRNKDVEAASDCRVDNLLEAYFEIKLQK